MLGLFAATQASVSNLTIISGEGMTFCNRTPELNTLSTPSTTDDFRYRYAKTEMAVLSDRRLTQNDKTVYAVLKAHRNHRTGTAWPSRQLIGQIAGCTDRAVSLATSRLVQAGYLTKESRTGRSTLYGFPLACQPDDTFRGTPERTFTHNLTISNNTKKTPLHRQLAENVVDVVVVDSVIAKENFPLRVGGIEVERATPAAAPGNLVERATPAAAPGNLVERATPAAAPGNLVERATPAAAPGNLVERATPAAAPGNLVERATPAAAPGNLVKTSTQNETLTLPVFLTVAIQAQIVRVLCGLPFADAQMLLDELHGAAQHNTIRNPIAYLRRLLSLHLSGTLIPEHSDRIAALRASQRRNQAAIQRALAMRPGERPPDTPPPTQKRDDSVRLAEMAKMRAALGMRQPGAG